FAYLGCCWPLSNVYPCEKIPTYDMAYVSSSALDCGVTFSALVIFVALQNQNISFPSWWGTGGVYHDGCPLSQATFNDSFP
ncbi:unnamed protein product, partial [Didymodactylos carnosus]